MQLEEVHQMLHFPAFYVQIAGMYGLTLTSDGSELAFMRMQMPTALSTKAWSVHPGNCPAR